MHASLSLPLLLLILSTPAIGQPDWCDIFRTPSPEEVELRRQAELRRRQAELRKAACEQQKRCNEYLEPIEQQAIKDGKQHCVAIGKKLFAQFNQRIHMALREIEHKEEQLKEEEKVTTNSSQSGCRLVDKEFKLREVFIRKELEYEAMEDKHPECKEILSLYKGLHPYEKDEVYRRRDCYNEVMGVNGLWEEHGKRVDELEQKIREEYKQSHK